MDVSVDGTGLSFLNSTALALVIENSSILRVVRAVASTWCTVFLDPDFALTDWRDIKVKSYGRDSVGWVAHLVKTHVV